MQTYLTLDQIDQVTGAVRARISVKPRVGIILGSGLNDLAASVKNATTIPYGDLPPWPVSTVEGHVGRLVIGDEHDIPGNKFRIHTPGSVGDDHGIQPQALHNTNR